MRPVNSKHIVLFLLALAISACSNYTMHPELAQSGANMVSAHNCRECHTVIYEEWRNSAHSKAFTNTFFKDITSDYQIDGCLPCHAPESAFAGEKQLRQINLEEGINCQSCHLQDGFLQGPVERHLPFAIHPIKQVDIYRESRFCGQCHIGTYEEYSASGKPKKSCQQCHMPTVKRTIIDNKPWVWTKKEYDFKRHSFDIMDLAEIGAKLQISLSLDEQSPPSGQVTISNNAIPHNIPTGTYGYHEIRLNIYLLDDLGEPKGQQYFSFTQEMDSAIKPGETRNIHFTFPKTIDLPFGVKAVLVRAHMDQQETAIIAKTVELF